MRTSQLHLTFVGETGLSLPDFLKDRIMMIETGFFSLNYMSSTKQRLVTEVLDKNLNDLHSVPGFATIFLDHYGQVLCVIFRSLPFSYL